MAITGRGELKKAFEKGAIPSQEDFENLIDSMLHKQDDGLISQEEGLKLSPKGSSKRLLSFFNNLTDFKPKWSIGQYPQNSPEFGLNIVDEQGLSRLFIKSDGKVGIGTLEPKAALEVKGNINMQGRRGTYSFGEVPGDGEWHNITPKLSSYHAFEVIAKIGKPGKGMYAMVHAFALSTFGNSKSKIKKTDAYYSSFRNKIALRWKGSTFDYYLQIKTRRDYGDESFIKYYITNLWWDEQNE
ncbi:MAG: adhesin [Cytophagales bacterium]|nr:adhesin [Cytophagales bacterium]